MSGETALVIPVPEAEPIVGRWREKYDAAAAAGVPAHVTLLYPFLEPEAIGAGDIAALSLFFASARPVEIVFETTGRFGDNALWLAPEPPEPFAALTLGLVQAWPECPPYRGAHANVVPHLTVADHGASHLFDTIDLALAGGLPVRTRLTEAWLLENRTGRWVVRQRFTIGE